MDCLCAALSNMGSHDMFMGSVLRFKHNVIYWILDAPFTNTKEPRHQTSLPIPFNYYQMYVISVYTVMLSSVLLIFCLAHYS